MTITDLQKLILQFVKFGTLKTPGCGRKALKQTKFKTIAVANAQINSRHFYCFVNIQVFDYAA